MAHIVYGGKQYPIKDSDIEATRAEIVKAMKQPGVAEMVLTDDDGDVSYIYITAGTPIAIRSWDAAFPG